MDPPAELHLTAAGPQAEAGQVVEPPGMFCLEPLSCCQPPAFGRDSGCESDQQGRGLSSGFPSFWKSGLVCGWGRQWILPRCPGKAAGESLGGQEQGSSYLRNYSSPPPFQIRGWVPKLFFFTQTRRQSHYLWGGQSFFCQNWRLEELKEKNRPLVNTIINRPEIPASFRANGFTAELITDFPFLFC